jgi:hypothetical protein
MQCNAGNLEEAERLLGKALKAFPDSTRVRLSYAELFELRVRKLLILLSQLLLSFNF